MGGIGKSKNIIVFGSGAIVILSLIALIASIVIANRLQNEIAHQQLGILNERVDIENRAFFNELNTNLRMIEGLVVSGIFRDVEVSKWSSGILPVLKSNSNITAVSVVNNFGNEYVVSLNDSLLSYYLIKDENESIATVYTRDLSNGLVHYIDTVISTRAINFSSFENHVLNNPDTIVWSGLQAIPGIEKMAGFAATLKTLDKPDEDQFAISIYVSLNRLDKFLKVNSKLVNGDLFLFTKDMRLFDFENKSTDTVNSHLSDYLISRENITNPLYKEALFMLEKVKPDDSVSFHSFQFDNHKYWGAYRTTHRGENNLRVALVVPEDDLFNVLKGKVGFLFFPASLVLVFSSIILAVAIRRKLIKETKNKYLETDDILKLIENGEDDFTEFKSTIRMNLFSNKPGKEIELAWLKSVVAFCNTNGGNILIGINDEGKILGLDADIFPNDDKCMLHVQSLLRDHIGMEFSSYINYRLHTVNDKKFLAVHCTPSPKPLFLSSNNKEQFYVRSGPASIELSTSKALKYIEDRKKD